MHNPGRTVLRTTATVVSALLLAAGAAACSGSDDEVNDDEAPTLGDFETGDLDAPESVHPGEPFDVQTPGGPDRATYYDLYTQSGDDWVLQQILGISRGQSPPVARTWEPNENVPPIGYGGPGPDQITTLDDTTPGNYLVCIELPEERVTTCTDLSITAP